MGKISNFFKSLFGFKPSDPKRRGWTLFKSSHKQYNHDKVISADRGSVQSRPPSVVAKLMGQEALPDSATINPKQEMGVSPPFYAVTFKGHASTRMVPFIPGKMTVLEAVLVATLTTPTTCRTLSLHRLRSVKKKKEDVNLDEEDDGLKTILWEEVLNRAESWTDYDGELPVIALEVERLIFKDLVNEVVLGEASHGKRIQPGRCRRRLSSK
ncbi:longifolia 1-like protein [Tanacetum coccineum]|uniref:Longifolia 1-like protein n=1 Tax=Tanacetum coccineum TaxID=301880 RepID=A0ABQ5F0K0_9ASTR